MTPERNIPGTIRVKGSMHNTIVSATQSSACCCSDNGWQSVPWERAALSLIQRRVSE